MKSDNAEMRTGDLIFKNVTLWDYEDNESTPISIDMTATDMKNMNVLDRYITWHTSRPVTGNDWAKNSRQRERQEGLDSDSYYTILIARRRVIMQILKCVQGVEKQA